MPDEERDRGERERIVHGAGAGEDEPVVALAEPEEEAREREEQRERDREEGVDLLARVEAALRALRPRSQRRSSRSIVSISRQSSARRLRLPTIRITTSAIAQATATQRCTFLTRCLREINVDRAGR